MSLIAAGVALLFGGAALPEAHWSSGAGAAEEVEVVAVRPDASQRMTVPVSLGGEGPFRFLVDTGSQTTVLSSQVARRLSLPVTRSARIIGVGGESQAPTTRINRLALGRRTYDDLEVALLDGGHIGAQGILGTDSLQGQRLLIDFEKGLIAVSDARSLGGSGGFDIIVTARRRHGQLIMTDASIDGVATAVVIDTGSDTTIGNSALQRALSRSGAGTPNRLISVTGQQIEAQLIRADRLEMGGITLNQPVLAFAESPVFEHLRLSRRPALLLGMRELRAFRRVAVDFSTRKIYFDLPPGV